MFLVFLVASIFLSWENFYQKTDWRIRMIWVNKALWLKGSHYITHLCLIFYITWDRSNYEDLTCWDMRSVVELIFASMLLLPYTKRYIILKRITRCRNMKPALFTFQIHWPHIFGLKDVLVFQFPSLLTGMFFNGLRLIHVFKNLF